MQEKSFFGFARRFLLYLWAGKGRIMDENEERKKSLPVGQSFFDRVIEDRAYYVDKTLFIKTLLDCNAAVTLLTRPRRFGKTLNQTMLKCFFEDTTPLGGKDTRTLYSPLTIHLMTGVPDNI
jgi:hypothetical protein